MTPSTQQMPNETVLPPAPSVAPASEPVHEFEDGQQVYCAGILPAPGMQDHLGTHTPPGAMQATGSCTNGSAQQAGACSQGGAEDRTAADHVVEGAAAQLGTHEACVCSMMAQRASVVSNVSEQSSIHSAAPLAALPAGEWEGWHGMQLAAGVAAEVCLQSFASWAVACCSCRACDCSISAALLHTSGLCELYTNHDLLPGFVPHYLPTPRAG